VDKDPRNPGGHGEPVGDTHRERTYERLRDLIVHGKLAPGARIIEADVAERLGVSRTPVRAALQRLQQEGYITFAQRGRLTRASVAPLTRDDAHELFGIVGALEGFAAARTASLPDEERTSVAADLSKLNASLLQVGSSSRDPRSMFDLDSSFHHRYVETARGPRLLALLDAIKPQAERYIRLYTSALVDEIGTSVKEHEDIVEAIGRGDGEAARSAVATNWINASHRLSRVIDTVGERGSW
jgi:DNA-binding GntR family transcriptional regulator